MHQIWSIWLCFFLSLINCIHCYLLFLIMVASFTIQAMILFQVGVRVSGNTTRIFQNHRVAHQGDRHVLAANIYFRGTIPTLDLDHGTNLLNWHLTVNHLDWHIRLHLGGDSPGIILLCSNPLSSLHVVCTFILNGGLNCITSFMNFLSVSVSFLPRCFPCYIHHPFCCLWLWWQVVLHLFYQSLARFTCVGR